MNSELITSPSFDLWWESNGVKIETPVMQEAFREVAWKAWGTVEEARDEARQKAEDLRDEYCDVKLFPWEKNES